MRSKKVVLPIGITSLSLLIALLLIISRPEAEQVPLEKKPLLVEVVEVIKRDLQVTVRAQGTVVPRTETTLIAEVSGQVIEVAPVFLAGGFFLKGDLLLKIDDRNYRSQLKRAEAAVAGARSELAQEKGRGHVAKQDWQKRSNARKVKKEAKALALRQPQLVDAEANLASALADLDRARIDLQRTDIRAPYDGLVREKKVDVGQYVNAGVALGVTFAVDRAEVRLALAENKLPYLHLPDAFSSRSEDVSAPTYPKVVLSSQVDEQQYQWQAALVRTEGVLDDRSRVLFVVAQAEDPYGIHLDSRKSDFRPLRIGTFVDAKIEGRLIKDLISLPRYVLRTGNKLWVVDGEDRLEERVVKILRTGGSLIYVRSGLESGDRVCLTSLGPVLAGTKVRIASKTAQQPAS